MTVDWYSFQSCLGNLNNISVSYVDDKECEKPITNEYEFQKAIRYAKLHRPNPLHIILKCDNWEAKNGFFNNARFSTANYTKSLKEIKKNEKIQAKQLKENISQYEDKLPPTWFIQYMERFKKKLLKDIQFNINEAVHNAPNEELKEHVNKLETLFQTHVQSCSVINNKKYSEQNLSSLQEPRENKAFKTLATNGIPTTKLLKLIVDAIHKEKILASKRQIHRPYKSKTGKKYADASIKLFSKMKAVPQKVKDEGMKIIVPQGKDFSILWHLKDNGKKSSRNRKVLCSIKENILLKKLSFDFCQTKSGRVCTVCMEGETFSLDKAVGSNVYPSEEKYDPIVEVKKVNDPDIYFTEISKSLTKEDLTSNIIGESQRKIKKNITEIEDRLKIMNFLQPSNLKSSYLSSTDSDKVCKEAEVKVNKCIGILKCDEQDNTFVREINLEEKMNEGNSIIELILERDSIGTDSIQKQYSAHINEGLITTDEDTKAKERLSENSEKLNAENESDTDLSFLCNSENEVNFLVTPVPAISPCLDEELKEGAAEAMPSTSANKSKLDFDINQLTEEKRIRQEAIFDLASPTITQNHLKNKETDAEPKFKEINEDPCYSPRSRFPMTKESIEEKFSEYYFTAADSIDPIFTIHPVFKKGKKMFKGFTKKHNVANEDSKLPKSGQKHKIRITDSIGRVIFAVNAAGVCLPVSTILDDNIGVEKKENNKTNQKGRASARSKELSVNIFTNETLNKDFSKFALKVKKVDLVSE